MFKRPVVESRGMAWLTLSRSQTLRAPTGNLHGARCPPQLLALEILPTSNC
jgi:hypothetical protein